MGLRRHAVRASAATAETEPVQPAPVSMPRSMAGLHSNTLRTIAGAAMLLVLADAGARTVWRCLRDGTVSLATAPEPGSQCSERTLDDDAAALPNIWGALGVFHGTLYQREQDGRIVYSTRKLPGSTPVQQFSVATPAASPAHPGLGRIGKPQLGIFQREFRAAAKTTGLDE